MRKLTYGPVTGGPEIVHITEEQLNFLEKHGITVVVEHRGGHPCAYPFTARATKGKWITEFRGAGLEGLIGRVILAYTERCLPQAPKRPYVSSWLRSRGWGMSGTQATSEYKVFRDNVTYSVPSADYDSPSLAFMALAKMCEPDAFPNNGEEARKELEDAGFTVEGDKDRILVNRGEFWGSFDGIDGKPATENALDYINELLTIRAADLRAGDNRRANWLRLRGWKWKQLDGPTVAGGQCVRATKHSAVFQGNEETVWLQASASEEQHYEPERSSDDFTDREKEIVGLALDLLANRLKGEAITVQCNLNEVGSIKAKLKEVSGIKAKL